MADCLASEVAGETVLEQLARVEVVGLVLEM